MKQMIVKAVLLVAFVMVLATAEQTQAGIIYKHDDGSAESSLAGIGTTETNIWLNAFTAVAGGERIESIDIAFGFNWGQGSPVDGTPATVYLWTTATNNANPGVDAIVQTTVASSIQNVHTDTFVNFVLPTPVDLNVGDVFFVGFQSTGFAVGRDLNSSAGMSWIATNNNTIQMDPNALGAAVDFGEFGSLGFPGNALIRANGVNAVPEPASLAIFGTICLIGCGRRRRS